MAHAPGVAIEPRADGTVVTTEELSPKLGGRAHTLFWAGPSSPHPGATIWSSTPDEAAVFPTQDAAIEALQRLHAPHRVMPFQLALFHPGADEGGERG